MKAKAPVKKAPSNKVAPKKVVKKVKETLGQKALRLLSDVPSKDFITYNFTDCIGKCCAIGHYQRLTSKDPTNYEASNCHDSHVSELRALSRQFISDEYKIYSTIAHVNNRKGINGYNQAKVKDRVIALLTDMVEKGL